MTEQELIARIDALKAENAELTARLSRVEAERDAAAFIQHVDREYGRNISDAGFERWRGAQGEA